MADLINMAVAIGIGALVIGGLWYAARPPCVLLLALEEGRLRLVRGKSTAAFLEAAQSICSEFGLVHGEIRGDRRGNGVRFAFSTSIPPEVQQRLRNVWQLHR
jgi:hypothetical protein